MTDFPLIIEPGDKILFFSKFLGDQACSVTINVKNSTKEHQACKVKCTNNEMFKIRPPVSTIKPESSGKIVITFNPKKQIPECGKHFFNFYSCPFDGELNPRKFFATEKAKDSMSKKIFVDFKKEEEVKENDKENKDVEKKDVEKKDNEKKENNEKIDNEKKE
uniref:Major sperm protein n=1 Tax=Strongyloides venezuelensis TaxID=75913 RepID=A0A0K0FLF0_STRVS